MFYWALVWLPCAIKLWEGLIDISLSQAELYVVEWTCMEAWQERWGEGKIPT